MRDDGVEISTLRRRDAVQIVRDPRIRGGEPTVAGARIPVSAVIVQWQFYRDRERLLRAFPRLNDESLDAVLAYYETHRQEIDRLIAEAEQAAHLGSPVVGGPFRA